MLFPALLLSSCFYTRPYTYYQKEPLIPVQIAEQKAVEPDKEKQRDDFTIRGAKWGMTKQQIRAIEKAEFIPPDIGAETTITLVASGEGYSATLTVEYAHLPGAEAAKKESDRKSAEGL